MTQAEMKRAKSIRDARREIAKAYRAIHVFKTKLKYLGPIGRVEPGFPPHFPNSPCGPRGRKIGPPKPITNQQFATAIGEIETMLGNAKRVYNKMYPSPRTRR